MDPNKISVSMDALQSAVLALAKSGQAMGDAVPSRPGQAS